MWNVSVTQMIGLNQSKKNFRRCRQRNFLIQPSSSAIDIDDTPKLEYRQTETATTFRYKETRPISKDNLIYITDDSGTERAMEIVLQFKEEDIGCEYVLIKDPEEEDGDIFACLYDGTDLTVVENEDTLNMCAEVLEAYYEAMESDGLEGSPESD